MFIWKRVGNGNQLTPQASCLIGRVKTPTAGNQQGSNTASWVMAGLILVMPIAQGYAATAAEPCIIKYKGDENYVVTQKIKADGTLLKTNCSSAGDAPICAFKTWQACLTWAEPKWCADVGQPGMVFDDAEGRGPGLPPKPDKPWQADLTQPDLARVYGRVVAAKTIDDSRCKLPSTFDNGIDKYRGLTEVMVVAEDDASTNYIERNSVLVNKIDGKWQVVGWTSWAEPELCLWEEYKDDPRGKIYCDIYAPIGPWALPGEKTPRPQ